MASWVDLGSALRHSGLTSDKCRRGPDAISPHWAIWTMQILRIEAVGHTRHVGFHKFFSPRHPAPRPGTKRVHGAGIHHGYRSAHRGHGGLEAPDKLNLWSPVVTGPEVRPLARLDPQRQIISRSYHHRRPLSLVGGGARINKNPMRTQHSGRRHETAREASGSSLPGLSLPSPIRSSHHDHAAVPLPVRLAFLFSGLFSTLLSFAVDNSTASSSPSPFPSLPTVLGLCFFPGTSRSAPALRPPPAPPAWKPPRLGPI